MLIWRVVRILWSMLDRRRRGVFLALVATMFVAGLLEMSGMIVLFGYTKGLVVNQATGARGGPLAAALTRMFGPLDQLSYAIAGGATVVAVMVVKNLLTTIAQFGLTRFLMKLNERVSRALFEGYLHARFETFTARGNEGPARKIGRGFDLMLTCFAALAQILSDSTILFMVALLLVFVDPGMTLVGVAVFGGAGASLYFFTERGVATMSQRESAARKLSKRSLTEGFAGVIDGRLNGTQSLFVDGYVKALAETALTRRRKLAIARLPQSTNEVLLATTIVLGVLYLTLRGRSLVDALPTLAIFAFAGLKLTGAMSRVSKGFQTIREQYEELEHFTAEVRMLAPRAFRGAELSERTDHYLEDELPLPSGVDGRLHERLELTNVVFTYPGVQTPAIDHVNLTLERGSFVSFCGPSGGGKSTLVMLLMGLIKPDSGDILCDGTSVFSHVRAYHAGIGYVGQKMFIAQRTVRENVTFGTPLHTVDDERVWRALEMARAADFVRALPGGLDSDLREGGSLLSGGQRQRIVIARALYKDPEILFFDEATAALDNVTEQEITSAIIGLSRHKTVVCVAHRLSTIRASDVIHFVENGKITASGSYDELLASSDAFRRLARVGEHEGRD